MDGYGSHYSLKAVPVSIVTRHDIWVVSSLSLLFQDPCPTSQVGTTGQQQLQAHHRPTEAVTTEAQPSCHRPSPMSAVSSLASQTD